MLSVFSRTFGSSPCTELPQTLTRLHSNLNSLKQKAVSPQMPCVLRIAQDMSRLT